MLRWSAYAAAAAPLAMAATPSPANAAGGPGGTVTPVNLELVTLAEDHAVITWYTGYAGTDDGLGRMVRRRPTARSSTALTRAGSTAWPTACPATRPTTTSS
jgi:hypothetical protein